MASDDTNSVAGFSWVAPPGHVVERSDEGLTRKGNECVKMQAAHALRSIPRPYPQSAILASVSHFQMDFY
jgi:hypothetical protein